ncbi:hypothetical protein GT347_06130 [Xylophilus rhododendri]|uniref:Uncharacterized protein n=1 Tax=Xylophilus rhododendri TaxID=2697032 RepID=A0A857J3G6_9BURK|nr:hypothetical protein [Xylophilus rhododendri]QHI97602.1 hypothetical protein GT347_06130 [Xylophilus rhododendri]
MSEPRQPANTQNPTEEAVRAGEVTGGNRGKLSGRDDDQRRAVAQENPLTEGSRQGRERYKQSLDSELPSDADKAV